MPDTTIISLENLTASELKALERKIKTSLMNKRRCFEVTLRFEFEDGKAEVDSIDVFHLENVAGTLACLYKIDPYSLDKDAVLVSSKEVDL
jgi:hypothetical protein